MTRAKSPGTPRTSKKGGAHKKLPVVQKTLNKLERNIRDETKAQKEYGRQASDPVLTPKQQVKLAEISAEEAVHKMENAKIAAEVAKGTPPPPPPSP